MRNAPAILISLVSCSVLGVGGCAQPPQATELDLARSQLAARDYRTAETTAQTYIARDPDALMGGKFGEALRQLGTTLQEDPDLARTINRFARRAAVGAAADYGDAIVRLVSETVRGWDAQTITRRLENAVGRDLQYIRINGTLVGGLVGLAIHAVDVSL